MVSAVSVSVGVFALRGAHAERAEALHEFGAVEAFLCTRQQVLYLDVFVEIDEVTRGRMRENRIGVRHLARALRP